MKCPFCGCEDFFVKDPDDEYETYAFSVGSGEIVVSENTDASECPAIGDETHIYCDQCSWHGKFKELKS